MFGLIWSMLTGKPVRSDGRSWPWRKIRRAKNLHRCLFRLKEKLVRDIEIADGDSVFRFRCGTLVELQRCVNMFRKEPGTCEWIRNEIGPGDIFYDIGANIGIYSILAAHHVGKTGKVYAFEPHSANFTHLLDNITLNKLEQIVIPCNFPLYQDNTFLPFCYFSTEPGSSFSQLFSIDESAWGMRQTQISELKCAVSIDSMIASGTLPAPDHVKIDVDGGESLILRGMDRLLASSEKPKSIQVEMGKASEDEIVAIMEAHGYDLTTKHYTRDGLNLIERGVEPKSYNAVFQRPQARIMK
jgi:FkbM family methyltransferase